MKMLVAKCFPKRNKDVKLLLSAVLPGTLMLIISASSPAQVTYKASTPIPVGLDAYHSWERWPKQRIGMRT